MKLFKYSCIQVLFLFVLRLVVSAQGETCVSGMVQKNGVQFVVNGNPLYVNGFNAYWLMVSATDSSTRTKVTQLLKEAAAVGLNVGRTWAFNDGDTAWKALQKSPGVYDENVFRALDFVIDEARKTDIRLILSLSNNWNDYGGKAQYLKWGRSAGLNLTSEDQFFSHTTLKAYFKAHIKAVLNRVNSISNVAYKDDPTIFGWELMNEPRCPSDPSGDILQAWIQEMASYVKSIDSQHLLEIGTEGFYGPSTPDRLHFNPNTFAQQVGTDFIRNHQATGIDFASTHIYADTWISDTISPTYLDFVKNWTQCHIQDCQDNLKIPLIFVEYGLSDRDRGFTTSFRKQFMESVYDSIKVGGAAGGCLLWQLFAAGMEYLDDGYQIVLSQSPPTIRNLIYQQSQRLSTFSACV